MRWLILMVVFLAVGGLSACSTPPPAALANPTDIDVSEYDRIYAAAGPVLRDAGFALDRQDYRFGTISTRPLTSPTLMEPWRPSNVSLGDAVESTVNHHRRIAVVRLRPRPPAATDTDAQSSAGEAEPAPSQAETAPAVYDLEVVVTVERLAVPLRRLTGSTRGTTMVRPLRSVPAEWQDRGIEPAYWIAVGRDQPLERQLLADILRRASRPPERPS